MGICKIRYMNVVANCCSISCRIIGPVNLHMGTTAQCRLNHQGNKVCFRIVVLPGFTFRICSGCIEIAQRYRADTMRVVEIAQYSFDHLL